MPNRGGMLPILALLLACVSSAPSPPAAGSLQPGPNQGQGQTQTHLLWPLTFKRSIWQSSCVVENMLYIDGGEIYTTDGDSAYTFASTLTVNLTLSWDQTNITVMAIDKIAPFPHARQPWIWLARGGVLNYLAAWTYSEQVGWYAKAGEWGLATTPGTTSLWELTTSFIGSAWDNKAIQPPSTGVDQISINTGYLSASSNTTAFALGGISIPSFSPEVICHTGMASYDVTTAQWQNVSTTNPSYGINGWGAFGQAVYAPTYGEKGILIFLGGFTPTSQVFGFPSNQESLLQLDHIYMYDIASQKFFEQPATGDIPGARWAFCAVGVEDAIGAGFDIFIHGGTYGPESQADYQPGYDDIWALSLPSFQWTQIAETTQTMRAFHTCEVIGNRQMIVIGGDNINSTGTAAIPDPWENGISIFDMTALQWSTSYDANQAPYSRSDVLKSAVGSNTFPSNSTSPLATSIFIPAPVNSTSSQSTNSTSSQSTNTSNPVATPGESEPKAKPDTSVLVGSIVGGVIGLAALSAFIWLSILRLRRRPSKRAASPQVVKSETKPNQQTRWGKHKSAISELAGGRCSRVELDSSAMISELDSHQISRVSRRQQPMPPLPHYESYAMQASGQDENTTMQERHDADTRI